MNRNDLYTDMLEMDIRFFLEVMGLFLRWKKKSFFVSCCLHAGDSGGGLLDAVAKVCAGVNPMEVGG